MHLVSKGVGIPRFRSVSVMYWAISAVLWNFSEILWDEVLECIGYVFERVTRYVAVVQLDELNWGGKRALK